jgi:SAM-dependent methyltransferase
MMSPYGKDFAEFYNQHWAEWTERIWLFVSRTVKTCCPKASSWLDLCCGTGQLLRKVTGRGFTATGLDRSPHQLRHARRNAPKAKLVRADVRQFSLPERHDVITCLFDSLNYILTPVGLKAAFANAREHLNPGGVFIFDMNTEAGYLKHWNHASVRVREKARLLVMDTSYDRKARLALCSIIGFIGVGNRYRRFEERHLQRAFPEKTLDTMLKQLSFTFRKYDGYRFTRPRKDSGRWFYVCCLKGQK